MPQFQNSLPRAQNPYSLRHNLIGIKAQVYWWCFEVCAGLAYVDNYQIFGGFL